MNISFVTSQKYTETLCLITNFNENLIEIDNTVALKFTNYHLS